MTLKTRYEEIMDRIEVTDEMRGRILKNLGELDWSQTSYAKAARISPWKRSLSIAACFILLLAGTLALPGILEREPFDDAPVVINPGGKITEVTSSEELSEAVGFTVADIELPFVPEQRIYTAFGTELAQIQYQGEGQSAIFRKSVGTEDNSGDYNSYSETEEITAGPVQGTLKGESGTYTLAVWTDGEFSYSLALTEGLPAENWEVLINEINLVP